MTKRAWIPIDVVREVTATPCVVCGIPFDLRCDHIIPVAAGGSNDRTNLQSLCRACNHIKHCTKTTDEVRSIVESRGFDHFLRAVWLHDTRHHNPYCKPGLDEWRHAMPERTRFAAALHATFATALRKSAA